VQKIDLSNIQLILSLKKYCDEKNIKLNITNITAKSVKQTLKMFNLNSTLGVE
jgi:ABC-type transporter Mla MlaB component